MSVFPEILKSHQAGKFIPDLSKTETTATGKRLWASLEITNEEWQKEIDARVTAQAAAAAKTEAQVVAEAKAAHDAAIAKAEAELTLIQNVD